jgi:hypothetical protein
MLGIENKFRDIVGDLNAVAGVVLPNYLGDEFQYTPQILTSHEIHTSRQRKRHLSMVFEISASFFAV